MNVDNALLYLEFVAERHRVWERRQSGDPRPWTDDVVLNTTKFTNVYRVLDAGSQFLLKDMLLPGEDEWIERAFRACLYRFTNRPDPWQRFIKTVGRPPRIEDLLDGTVAAVLDVHDRSGDKTYSTAYRVNIPLRCAGQRKTPWILGELERWWGSEAWMTKLESYRGDPEAMHSHLMKIERCAEFMGQQIITDIAYFDPLSDEDAFVAPGPGSRRGAADLGLPPLDAFKWAKAQLDPGPVFLTLPSGAVRYPSLMDVQNTFCEFGKYVLRSDLDRRTVSRNYRAGIQTPPAPVFPPHWG